MKTRPLSDLEGLLGYRFEKRELLERALTHSSARGARLTPSDNERLEFIGDRVLGLAIAEMLSETMPKAREGELAKKFNQLVRGETCTLIARRLELGSFLTLSSSEEESGGREKDTILADAMEALLAAVFLDGGFDRAKDLIRGLWQDVQCDLPAHVQDPKSALQEWAQGQGLPLPKYLEVERSGPDHSPIFVAEVKVKGQDGARGEGASKRAAEQAAARSLLVREGVWRDKA